MGSFGWKHTSLTLPVCPGSLATEIDRPVPLSHRQEAHSESGCELACKPTGAVSCPK